MAELKKNSTVCIRLRPNTDVSSGVIVRLDGPGRVVCMDRGVERVCECDATYDERASNQLIADEQIETLVQRACTGYNTAIITYGTTRSGRSYTLFGSHATASASATATAASSSSASSSPSSPPLSPGLIDLALTSLLSRLSSMSGSSKSLVLISAYDVYNSHIVDLLRPNSRVGLQLSETARAGRCCVEGIAEIAVTHVDDARTLIAQAKAVHDALDIRLSPQLGKPHTIVDIRVEVIDADSPSTIKASTMRFCSPAATGGVQLKFNTGLQALNKVIDALSSEKDAWQVPYSSSRLTRLLESALGGNCLTLWLVCLDPSERLAADTILCLDLVDRVRRIRCSARLNKSTLSATIRELRDEIKKARGRLQLTQPGSYMHDIDPQQMNILKQLIMELERVKAQTWERRRQRSQEAAEQRREALQAEGLQHVLAVTHSSASASASSSSESLEQLASTSKALLQSLVSQKASVDDIENEVSERRHLFQLRLEALQRKAAAAADAAVADATLALPSTSDLIQRDDKLGKLHRSMLESEEKLRLNQVELRKIEDEYRKLLTKQANTESQQRKLMLLNKDAAGIEKLNKASEWSALRREMDADQHLQDILQTIQTNTDAQKQSINASDDQAAIKQAALQTMDTLRETTESLKRLEWERDALWGRLIESQFKHEVQMARYQEHMFFMFRNYRSHFDESKDRIERRYRELLESSIKDALKLSEENNKLKALLDTKLKQI